MSRTLIGLISTCSEGATDWIAPSMPKPVAAVGSRRTAARVTRGAISLSSSIHFALMPNSNRVNPVALPPGRARLVTKPEPTGSETCTNTTGTVRVAASSGPFRRVAGIAPATPAVIDLQVASDVPPQFPKSLQERPVAGL